MSIPATEMRLVLMQDHEEYIRHFLGTERRTTLYLAASETEERAFYSFMAPADMLDGLLVNTNWDLRVGDGQPGFCTSYEGTLYDRLGHNDGLESIVHVRTQRQDDVVELIEEFRLLYDLYYGPNHDLFRWTPAGEKESVGTVSPTKVEINTRLLRQFLAVKGKCLVVCFHHRRNFQFEISEVSEADHSREYKDSNTYINFWLTDMIAGLADEKEKTVASFAGKKVIRPLALEDCGIPPYQSSRDEGFETFIVGQNQDGKDVWHSCDPEGLSDYFGRKKSAPSFLTPICFRRDVLTHYYNQTGKYSVNDGGVTCTGFWTLSVDNNGPDSVFVFLGDLSGIPRAEQLHWKSFNIASTGTMSKTALARSFEGEFADAASLDFVFKNRLADLELWWIVKHGWPLFHPLSKDDTHFLDSLHIPAVSDQGHFDRQILNLAKVFVDRLDVTQIASVCGKAPEQAGGINALERYLEEKSVAHAKGAVSILRDIQSLRSSGTAHLKGERYEKLATRLGLTSDNLIEAFRSLLQRSIDFISDLEKNGIIEKPKA
jgi:hypothetical protein